MSTRKRLLSIALLALPLSCAKVPSIERVRFEVGVSDSVAKLVTYEKTPPSDNSSKFHGIGEKGITTTEGIGIVLNIEPQANGSPDDLDGELTASTADDKIATVQIVEESETPHRRVVLLAQAPGTTQLTIKVAYHDGSVDIPITVKPQQ